MSIFAVAPRVGAGIETNYGTPDSDGFMVAPRVGAGIETDSSRFNFGHAKVAPRVGAGIETTTFCTSCMSLASPLE